MPKLKSKKFPASASHMLKHVASLNCCRGSLRVGQMGSWTLRVLDPGVVKVVRMVSGEPMTTQGFRKVLRLATARCSNKTLPQRPPVSSFDSLCIFSWISCILCVLFCVFCVVSVFDFCSALFHVYMSDSHLHVPLRIQLQLRHQNQKLHPLLAW